MATVNGNHNGISSEPFKSNGLAVDPNSYILVTGGAGYIGSHTVVEIIAAGYQAVIVDNLCNSSFESVNRIEKITGKKIPFYKVDLLDSDSLRKVFSQHNFSVVIHFAGLKAVGESCQKPLMYYKNNVEGTISLLEVMKENNLYNIIFSSSATVYGEPQHLPLTESHPTGACSNAYGRSKYFIEQMLSDLCQSDKRWNAVLLRYFNPVGAHISGTIGEDPQGPPNNLMPYVAQVAVGRRATLSVYGNDYDTPDGTGVRDYVHVVDLAEGHVAALKAIAAGCRCKAYNIGTGNGYSVLDMVKAFEAASGKKVSYEFVDRRPGDLATLYGDASLAGKELGWKAKKGLEEMCNDLWRWQSQNPNGFHPAA